MNSFLSSPSSLTQLEFPVLTSLIAENCQTPKAKSAVSALSCLTNSAEVIGRMTEVYEAWRFIREIGTLGRSGWVDLTGVDNSWVIPGKVIPIEHLLIMRSLVETHSLLYHSISTGQASFPALFMVLRGQSPLTELIKRFRKIFDDNGEVLDSASTELGDIRRELRRLQSKITHRSQDILTHFLKEKMLGGQQMTIRNGRLVLPVLAEHKRKIKGFIHDISGSGQTVFIEPQELVELNNDLFELRSEEKKEIFRILSILSDDIRLHSSALKEIEVIMIELDEIQAKAEFLQPFHVVMPGLSDKIEWKLQFAYHPLLFLSRKEKKLPTIPLNLTLGTEGEQFVIISGPNAGGKSVAMKTVGLLQLMVQSGLPVPVGSDSVFPMVTGVFTVIGDSQSISDDLSSFSGHIRSIKEILVSAELDGSLVLIDEICSGTDPIEGQALAIELIETFIRRNYYGIVTSHFPDLKVFAQEHPKLKNGSMVFDTDKLVPTYEFRKGIPGSSFALELAERMELDPHLLENARKRLGTGSATIEKLNLELEKRLNDVVSKGKELQTEIEKVRNRETQVAESLRDLKSREKALKASLRSQVQVEIENLKRSVFQQIEALKKEKHIDFSKVEKQVLQTIAKTEDKVEAEDPGELISVSKGDQVRVKSTSQNGEVLSVEQDVATVQVGNFKMKIPVRDLVKGTNPKPRLSAPQTSPSDFTVEMASEIHLLGLTVTEALDKLDFYLSKAYFHKLPSVRIVHGKGTGALRKAIHIHLKEMDYIDEFGLGEWYEGSTGVTVVKFKK
ncbi:MAG: Smr/MutS family protein [Bacteroidetes bacterium]|nr:Smr/MutS family protein [Bacteroidota bacterium]